MIGKTINRYKIIGNINNRVVIAHNPNAIEPWVVWWLDKDGDPYSGSFCKQKFRCKRVYGESIQCVIK